MMEQERVYGRKIIRESKPQRYRAVSYIKVSFVIFLLVMFFLGTLFGHFLGTLFGHFLNNDNKVVLIEKDLKKYGENAKTMEYETYISDKLSKYVPLDVPLDDELQEFIFDISSGYDIDFSLVMALIEKESSFRTNVKSNTDDYGLMQINQINHKWLSETLDINDFNEPHNNIRAGMFILRGLFDRYGDNAHKVLMAYNMGENGAKKLWDKGVYQTPYSINIINKANNFRKEHKNGE